MATSVIRTFDLYNTTFYWLGYSIPEYEIEQEVAQARYYVSFSSNIIGSEIDFYNRLGNIKNDNNSVFTLNTSLTSLSYLWKKYWWDEAMYYSHPITLNTIKQNIPSVYQDFSESVGSLYYISRLNNLNNTESVPYNTIITNLLPRGVSDSVNNFYLKANSMFVTSTSNSASNIAFNMANADLTRREDSNAGLVAVIANRYPNLVDFLPYSTESIGNLLTPYYWSVSANCEGNVIKLGINNTTIQTLVQPPTNTLIAT